MRGGGRVEVDADEVVELLNKIRREVNNGFDELGRYLAAGLISEPQAPARQRRAEKASRPITPESGVNIPSDGWTSYKTKGPAGPNESGWIFASDQADNIHAEVKDLVEKIYESGKVTQGVFTYTLSKDGKFLQRNLPRKSRRG